MKKVIKLILNRVLSKRAGSIVVASSGRSGSTMLYNAILAAQVRKNDFVSKIIGMQLTKKIIGGFIVNLSSSSCYYVCSVCKTHSLANRQLTECGNKYIFIYGDPLESISSVISVKNKLGGEWFKRHQKHLSAKGDFSEIFDKDVTNYIGQIDSWKGARGDNVLIIDYKDLWDKAEEISDFVGFAVELPAFSKRLSSKDYVDSKINSSFSKKLYSAYKSIKE